VIINLLFEVICFALIGKIGYHKESKKATAMMTSIFVTKFMNTALLILLINANFSEFAILSFLKLPYVNYGPYPDLTYEWYCNIGKSFVITLLFNIF
jgi:hypothetical protein